MATIDPTPTQRQGNWIIGQAAGAYTLAQALNALKTLQASVDAAIGVPHACGKCGAVHEQTWDRIIARPDGAAYAYRALAPVVSRWATVKANHPTLAAMVSAGALTDPTTLDVTWIGATEVS